MLHPRGDISLAIAVMLQLELINAVRSYGQVYCILGVSECLISANSV